MSDRNSRSFKPDTRGSKHKFQSISTSSFKSKQDLDHQGKGLAPYSKPGLSSLGKVSNRRIPKPHIESKRTENYGEDPDVQLVPKDGSGWVKATDGSGENDGFAGRRGESVSTNATEAISGVGANSQRLWSDPNSVNISSRLTKTGSNSDFPTLSAGANPVQVDTSFSLKPNRPSWKRGASGNCEESAQSVEAGSEQSKDFSHYPDMKPSFMKQKDQNLQMNVSTGSQQLAFKTKRDEEWKGPPVPGKESKEMNKIVELDKDAEGWAGATGEVDYNKKIVFSDDEESAAAAESGGATHSSEAHERRKQHQLNSADVHMGGSSDLSSKQRNKDYYLSNRVGQVDRKDDFFRGAKQSLYKDKQSFSTGKQNNGSGFFQINSIERASYENRDNASSRKSHSSNDPRSIQTVPLFDNSKSGRDFLENVAESPPQSVRRKGVGIESGGRRVPGAGATTSHDFKTAHSSNYSSINANFPTPFAPTKVSNHHMDGNNYNNNSYGYHQQHPTSYAVSSGAADYSNSSLLNSSAQMSNRSRNFGGNLEYGQQQPHLIDNTDKHNNTFRGSEMSSSNRNNGKQKEDRDMLRYSSSSGPLIDKGEEKVSSRQTSKVPLLSSRGMGDDYSVNYNNIINHSSSATGTTSNNRQHQLQQQQYNMMMPTSTLRNRYDSEGSTGSGKAMDAMRNFQMQFKQQTPDVMKPPPPSQPQSTAPGATATAPHPFFFPPPPPPPMIGSIEQQQLWQQYIMMAATSGRFPFPPMQPLVSSAGPVSLSSALEMPPMPPVMPTENLHRTAPDGTASTSESTNTSTNKIQPPSPVTQNTVNQSQRVASPLIEDTELNELPIAAKEEVKTRRVQRTKKVFLTDSSQPDPNEKTTDEPNIKILERPKEKNTADNHRAVSAASLFHTAKTEDDEEHQETNKVDSEMMQQSIPAHHQRNLQKKTFDLNLSPLPDYESRESWLNEEKDREHKERDPRQGRESHKYNTSAESQYEYEKQYKQWKFHTSGPDKHRNEQHSTQETIEGYNSSRNKTRKDKELFSNVPPHTKPSQPVANNSFSAPFSKWEAPSSKPSSTTHHQPGSWEVRRGGRGMNYSRTVAPARTSRSETTPHMRSGPSHHNQENLVDDNDFEYDIGTTSGTNVSRDNKAMSATSKAAEQPTETLPVKDLMSLEIRYDDLSENNRQKLQQDFLGDGTRRSDTSEARYGKKFSSSASRGSRNSTSRRSMPSDAHSGGGGVKTAENQQTFGNENISNQGESSDQKMEKETESKQIQQTLIQTSFEKQNYFAHSDPVSTASTNESVDNSSLTTNSKTSTSSVVDWNAQTPAATALFSDSPREKSLEVTTKQKLVNKTSSSGNSGSNRSSASANKENWESSPRSRRHADDIDLSTGTEDPLFDEQQENSKTFNANNDTKRKEGDESKNTSDVNGEVAPIHVDTNQSRTRNSNDGGNPSWDSKTSNTAAGKGSTNSTRSRGGARRGAGSSSLKQSNYYESGRRNVTSSHWGNASSSNYVYSEWDPYDYYGYEYGYNHQGYHMHHYPNPSDYSRNAPSQTAAQFYSSNHHQSSFGRRSRGGARSLGSGAATGVTGSVSGNVNKRSSLGKDRKQRLQLAHATGTGAERTDNSGANKSETGTIDRHRLTSSEQLYQDEWETASESSDFDKREYSKNDQVPTATNDLNNKNTTQHSLTSQWRNTNTDARIGKGMTSMLSSKKSFSSQRPVAGDRGRNNNSNNLSSASRVSAKAYNSNYESRETNNKASKTNTTRNNASSTSTTTAAATATNDQPQQPQKRRGPDISQYDMNRRSGIVVIDQNMRPNIASDDDCAEESFQEVISKRSKSQKAAASKQKNGSSPTNATEKEKTISPRVKGGINKKSSKVTAASVPRSRNNNNNNQDQDVSGRNVRPHNANRSPSDARNVLRNIQNFDSVQKQLTNRQPPNIESEHTFQSDPSSSGKNSMPTTPPPAKAGNAWDKPLQTLILQDNQLVPSLPMATSAKEINGATVNDSSGGNLDVNEVSASWTSSQSVAHNVSADNKKQNRKIVPQTNVSAATAPRQFTSQQFRMQQLQQNNEKNNSSSSSMQQQQHNQSEAAVLVRSSMTATAVAAASASSSIMKDMREAPSQPPPTHHNDTMSANVAQSSSVNSNNDQTSMAPFCYSESTDLNNFLKRFETVKPNETINSSSVALSLNATAPVDAMPIPATVNSITSNGVNVNRGGGALSSINDHHPDSINGMATAGTELADDSSMKQQIEDNLRHMMWTDTKEDEDDANVFHVGGVDQNAQHHSTVSSMSLAVHPSISSNNPAKVIPIGMITANNNNNSNNNNKKNGDSDGISLQSSKSQIVAPPISTSIEQSKVCTVKPQKQSNTSTGYNHSRNQITAAALAAAISMGMSPAEYQAVELQNQMNAFHPQPSLSNQGGYFDELATYNYGPGTTNIGQPPSFFDSSNAPFNDAAAVVAAAQQQQQQQPHHSLPHQHQFLSQHQKVNAQNVGALSQQQHPNTVPSSMANAPHPSWNSAPNVFYGEQATQAAGGHMTGANMNQSNTPYQQTQPTYNHLTNALETAAAAQQSAFNSFGFSPLLNMAPTPRGQQNTPHHAFMSQAHGHHAPVASQPTNYPSHMINQHSNNLTPGMTATAATYPGSAVQHPVQQSFDMNLNAFGTPHAHAQQSAGGKAMSPQSHLTSSNDFKHDFNIPFGFNDAATIFNSASSFKPDQSQSFMAGYARAPKNSSQFLPQSPFTLAPTQNLQQNNSNPTAAPYPPTNNSMLNSKMFSHSFTAPPKHDSSLFQAAAAAAAQKTLGFNSSHHGSFTNGGHSQFNKGVIPGSNSMQFNNPSQSQALMPPSQSSAVFVGHPNVYHPNAVGSVPANRMPSPIQRPNSIFPRPSTRASGPNSALTPTGGAPNTNNYSVNNGNGGVFSSMNSNANTIQRKNSNNTVDQSSNISSRPWSSDLSHNNSTMAPNKFPQNTLGFSPSATASNGTRGVVSNSNIAYDQNQNANMFSQRVPMNAFSHPPFRPRAMYVSNVAAMSASRFCTPLSNGTVSAYEGSETLANESYNPPNASAAPTSSTEAVNASANMTTTPPDNNHCFQQSDSSNSMQQPTSAGESSNSMCGGNGNSSSFSSTVNTLTESDNYSNSNMTTSQQQPLTTASSTAAATDVGLQQPTTNSDIASKMISITAEQQQQ